MVVGVPKALKFSRCIARNIAPGRPSCFGAARFGRRGLGGALGQSRRQKLLSFDPHAATKARGKQRELQFRWAALVARTLPQRALGGYSDQDSCMEKRTPQPR